MMHLYADKRESGTYYKIRETYREDGDIKVRNVLYLGAAEKILEKFKTTSLEDAELKTVSFGPAAVLRWAFEDLRLDKLFTKLLDSEEKHVFPAWRKIYLLVWRRFFQDLSMKEAVERYDDQVFPFWWREDVTTVQRLYQFLGESLDEEVIRRAEEELVQRAVDDDQVSKCHLDTTDYSTYVKDDTKYLRLGKSKEGIAGRRIVGLALALSDQGIPVLGTAYPGNRHDSKLFPELFCQLCKRLEAAGSNLEDVTLVFDRGFDDKNNFDLTKKSPLHVVAAVKRNRKTVEEIMNSAELGEFQESYETTIGRCYVSEGGRANIGGNSWRVVLSYHDSTRKKIQKKMEEQRKEAEKALSRSSNRLEEGGQGQPPTENSVRKKLKKILGKKYGCLNWTLKPKAKKLDWRWSREWNRKHELAAVQPIITDQDNWTPDRVAKTYFQRKDIEDMFHLTKKALIVPVKPSYVKENHLVVAHLFITFIGLLCYKHIKRKLPDNMTDKKIKTAIKELDMVIATENGSPSFKLANINQKTTPLLTTMNLKKYLPK